MNAIAKRGKALRLAVAMVFAAMMLAGCSNCTLPPVTPDGTWSGVVSNSYREGEDGYTIELDIDGSVISITDGDSSLVDATGTLTQQNGEAYTVALDLATAGEGQLFIDPTATYALLIVHASDAGYDYLIGVLQKGSLGAISFVEDDLVGDWAGTEFRVDAGLEVTSTSESTASVTDPDGLYLAGTDADGNFYGPLHLLDSTVGVYESSFDTVGWPLFSRYALGTMSADKQVFAVAFLTEKYEYTLDEVLPDQKFAVWVRQ
jgi:hypothetical protein